MRGKLLLFIILLISFEGLTQEIDAAFIAQHTYTDLKKALENPKEVYGLDLSGQALETFPEEIFQFTNLRVLDLGYNSNTQKGNQLSSLPAEIGQLRNLISLNLERNQLSSLPAEIGQLRNLEGLNLAHNQLSSLPVELRKLKKLSVLYLYNNPFTQIPPSLINWLKRHGYGYSDRIIIMLDNTIIDSTKLANRDSLMKSNNLNPSMLTDSLNTSMLPPNRDSLMTPANPNTSMTPKLEEIRLQLKIKEAEAKRFSDLATKERNKNKAQIILKEAEAKEFRDLAAKERNKNKADSLNSIAKIKELEAKSLKEEQELATLKGEEERRQLEITGLMSRLELQEKNLQVENQKFLFWVLLVIVCLILAGGLAVAFTLNRSRLKAQAAQKAIQEKNQELEALTEELRQQGDIVLAQRDNLTEKNNELEAIAEELRQQTEVLEDTNAELYNTQQLKDLMISAVNHDLRNPLNPILNFSSPDYPKLSEKERLAKINTYSGLMLKLIDNIMQVYRADKLIIQAAPSSLHRATEKAIEVMSLSQTHKPKIINEIPLESKALFDYAYIERTLENLLSNAIKYTPSAEKGGLVRFFSEVDTQNQSIRISIQDNGKGIAPDKFEEIFLPFVNPDAKSIGAAKSVGIGLTFCKTIIEAHKSKIEIESEVGKGTTFSFVLPYVAPESEAKLSTETDLKIVTLSDSEKETVATHLAEIRKLGLKNARLKRYLENMDLGKSEKLNAWKAALMQVRQKRDTEAFEQMTST